jgi:hypothetical protein
MSNNELMRELGNRMEEQGFRWRMVSVEHVGRVEGRNSSKEKEW